MPDNCKNFLERFDYRPKSLANSKKENRKQATKPEKPHPLLVAYQFQQLLDRGLVNSKAELARKHGLSRARVTQILNLLKLAGEIQKEIIGLSEQEQLFFSEWRLREIVGLESAERQVKAFQLLKMALQKR